MEAIASIAGYKYEDAETNASHSILVPAIRKILKERSSGQTVKDIFDLGCGNGSVTQILHEMGYNVAGVDPSEEGIQQANEAYPHLNLRPGSAYDDLRAEYGQFDALISLEVVEHVYSPRKYAATAYNLLRDSGFAIISTPYHGYLKNLALAATGKMDKHFTALWDHGHIKFWSMPTLTILLKEVGFREVTFERVGRVPALAKSMIAIAVK